MISRHIFGIRSKSISLDAVIMSFVSISLLTLLKVTEDMMVSTFRLIKHAVA